MSGRKLLRHIYYTENTMRRLTLFLRARSCSNLTPRALNSHDTAVKNSMTQYN